MFTARQDQGTAESELRDSVTASQADHMIDRQIGQHA